MQRVQMIDLHRGGRISNVVILEGELRVQLTEIITLAHKKAECVFDFMFDKSVNND